MKSVKYIMMSALVALSLSSCSESFLDHPADDRTEIDSEDKIIKLLTSSYPGGNYLWVCELSSDNLIDNQTPHMPTKSWDPQILSHYNYPSYDRADDQLYKFEPATMSTYSDHDQPGQIWEGFYSSIASVNAALEAIDKVAAETGMTARLKAARAEALLIRAYDHFCLVNVFCQPYKDAEASKRDIGVPYVTVSEDVVQKEYDRGNVAEVYDKIQADLEEGLASLDEQIFEKPKWHFNNKAAHAFAARFYLYKHEWQKTIDHANAVLGTDYSTLKDMMFDYAPLGDAYYGDDFANAWQNPAQNNNLLLISTYSVLARRSVGYRYSCAGPAAREVFLITSGRHAFWRSYYICPLTGVAGMFGSSTSDYGYRSGKISEQFEFTDKIAQIGYAHIIHRAFTANELLLERAEAKIMLKQYDAACEDMCNYWNISIEKLPDVDKATYGAYVNVATKAIIDSWYSDASHDNCFENWDFTQGVSSSYVIPHEATPYMNCLNEWRRWETSFEGLRFFDLKRWGLEYKHIVGLNSEEYPLPVNDPRRAIEVPWEAISAGMASSRGAMSAPANANIGLIDTKEFKTN
ncbi:MAG: RagB/SusD family nutrient uptake outer membrane protein [Prevotella sp.]|nr:RagB/SusD family nutrient uptake outer membrane protein [Prevotella sp.]MBO4658652.1 RagB/SusD family nutrient uptake outer membrane protein [Prevotella sp.]